MEPPSVTPPSESSPEVPRDIFVAAQPIFNRQLKVFAHELLFRSGPENFFPAGTDAGHATSSVISRGLEVPGLQALTAGKPVFINLPRTLFIEDFWSLLPRDQVVIELLETVEPDEQVLDACRRLRKQGYQLALDDFIDSPEWQVMLPFAS